MSQENPQMTHEEAVVILKVIARSRIAQNKLFSITVNPKIDDCWTEDEIETAIRLIEGHGHEEYADA